MEITIFTYWIWKSNWLEQGHSVLLGGQSCKKEVKEETENKELEIIWRCLSKLYVHVYIMLKLFTYVCVHMAVYM